jgi:hypothetical protein
MQEDADYVAVIDEQAVLAGSIVLSISRVSKELSLKELSTHPKRRGSLLGEHS